jgi:hypothetical protein
MSQHREVEEDIERFKSAEDPQQRGEIAKVVIRSLRMHTTIEEELPFR